ncbi:MAG: biotin--[acetyl-CoA-carboxylase] ligase [Oscillospiraceae bacterium]|nr:biotin--[acetyl-CoA-carboxylase] ligase [Oscillospiraceae bacterium]
MPLKDKVLAVLEENKGKSVSGSNIARSVGMTRSAVWKAVKTLREEGYSICAVTNRGYCLSEESDFLSEQSIVPNLKTKALGRKIDVFKTIDSTNNFAKSLAQLGAVHGTTVISEVQTQGKGRMGRDFYSPMGMGVYMSVIIRPKLSVEHSLLITSCAAVAVAEAVERVAEIDCKIKWVNDIYAGGKKLCGILTEASVDVEQGGLEYAIVGMGINVQNVTFPKNLADTATSVRLETDKPVSRSVLTAEILNCLEERLETIRDKSFLDEYRRRSNVIGERIEVTHNDVSEQMDCTGIDEIGRLLVRLDSGEEKALTSGTVRIVDSEKQENQD